MTRIKTSLIVLSLLVGNYTFCQESETHKWVEFETVYSALPWFNADGGIEQGAVYMDNADITAKINLDEILGLEENLSVFIYALGNHGGKATSLMGDFQVASNIEAPRTWRIFEFWLQRNLLSDRISFLAGLYDLNSEFDILIPGTLFINSSFGIGAEYAQSGVNGPSIFPISSLAVRLSTFIGNRTSFKVAVLDAVPGNPMDLTSNEINLSPRQGVLVAAEATLYTSRSYSSETRESSERSYVTRRRKVGREYGSLKNDKLNIGFWHYTSKFALLSNPERVSTGNYGVYLGVQKYIEFNESNYLAFFARYGMANPRFNRLVSALSGGMVWSSPILKVDDEFGLAFSSGFNGPNFQETQSGNETTETVLEFTYSVPIKPWLLLQPDVQYVINPSTNQNLENALSVAMLVQISIGL